MSQRSQTKRKNTHNIISFIQNYRKRKLIYSGRKQMSGCLGMGMEALKRKTGLQKGKRKIRDGEYLL
jgi:hypothetical protein